MYFIKVPAQGKPEVVEVTPNTTYEILKGGIGGGMIEHVTLTNEISLWCDDEFLLHDPLPPINGVATMLRMHTTGVPDFSRVMILGDVVFTGGADAEGNTLGIEDEALDALLSMLGLETP